MSIKTKVASETNVQPTDIDSYWIVTELKYLGIIMDANLNFENI